MDDIRYSELLFLRAVAKANRLTLDPRESERLYGLGLGLFASMVATLCEELYLTVESPEAAALLAHLRHEWHGEKEHHSISEYAWRNPREFFERLFRGTIMQSVSITFRGVRRIEELRELLKRDRILEPHGVILDLRYFEPDLRDALARDEAVPVSVLCSDMDHFKAINDNHGHKAGDEVMKAYLSGVRDAVEPHGTAYRGRGDEVKVVLVGVDPEGAKKIADRIRVAVKAISIDFEGKKLTGVSASIGVGTSPPHARSHELETLADAAQLRAKAEGRDRVVVANRG